ncbi:CDP-archaeol synthase [Candidatus Saccharibacteria bacterium CPR2]|nr:CDP-archaeol synthase [Candidatus Saccharibacteria bacterium CPR2]
MLEDIIFALWFFLPAGLANTVPVPAAKIKSLDFLNIPLDFNKTFRNKRIFGNHKTLRGVVIGVITGIITAIIQFFIYKNWDYMQQISPIDYSQISPIIWGSILALGALGGDAIKSFFKRQLDVKPGSSWFPFDQIDYIIGGIVASLIIMQLDLAYYILIMIIWFILHPIATTSGYLLKLKDTPI